jgi:hypothetical protein
MNAYKAILGGFTAFLVFTLLACPALAQISNTTPIVTNWTVEAFHNNVPGRKLEATTSAQARTAAQSLCGDYEGDMASKCLVLLKSRSLTSLTPSGPSYAVWFLDLEMSIVGGRRSYVVITAQRKD